MDVNFASAVIIPQVPYVSAILAHRKRAPSGIDICPPPGSLCGFFY